jgi:hypothetical protein
VTGESLGSPRLERGAAAQWASRVWLKELRTRLFASRAGLLAPEQPSLVVSRCGAHGCW